MKAIICVGISASGKTTWAEKFCRENEFININRDSFRFSLFGYKSWKDYVFSKRNESFITNICDTLIKTCAVTGLDIVISDTNLNKKYRMMLLSKLSSSGFDLEIKEFPITLEEAVKRDSTREMSVGESVLKRQYESWEQYLNEKAKVYES